MNKQKWRFDSSLEVVSRTFNSNDSLRDDTYPYFDKFPFDSRSTRIPDIIHRIREYLFETNELLRARFIAILSVGEREKLNERSSPMRPRLGRKSKTIGVDRYSLRLTKLPFVRVNHANELSIERDRLIARKPNERAISSRERGNCEQQLLPTQIDATLFPRDYDSNVSRNDNNSAIYFARLRIFITDIASVVRSISDRIDRTFHFSYERSSKNPERMGETKDPGSGRGPRYLGPSVFTQPASILHSVPERKIRKESKTRGGPFVYRDPTIDKSVANSVDNA